MVLQLADLVLLVDEVPQDGDLRAVVPAHEAGERAHVLREPAARVLDAGERPTGPLPQQEKAPARRVRHDEGVGGGTALLGHCWRLARTQAGLCAADTGRAGRARRPRTERP